MLFISTDETVNECDVKTSRFGEVKDFIFSVVRARRSLSILPNADESAVLSPVC